MASINNKDILLSALLNCRIRDLYVIQNAGFNIEDVLDKLYENNQDITIENMVQAMTDMALADMRNAINFKIDVDDLDENDVHELEKLHPEQDIVLFRAGRKTNLVGCSGKKQIYRKYVPDLLDRVSKETGMEICWD